MPNTKEVLQLSATNRAILFQEMNSEGLLPQAGKHIRTLSDPKTQTEEELLSMISPAILKYIRCEEHDEGDAMDSDED